MNNSSFNGIPILTNGNQSFVIDKFSGFSKVEISVNNCQYDDNKKLITYSMEFYFSGQTLKLKKFAEIKIFDEVPLFDPFSFKGILGKREYTTEYKFFNNAIQNGINNVFMCSEYNSGKSTDIIPDKIRWFAENTKTEEALSILEEDINFCINYINEHYPKKGLNKK